MGKQVGSAQYEILQGFIRLVSDQHFEKGSQANTYSCYRRAADHPDLKPYILLVLFRAALCFWHIL